MELIKDCLAIIGLLGFVITISRIIWLICKSNRTWKDNVTIKEIHQSELDVESFLNEDLTSSKVFVEDTTQKDFLSINEIRPQGCIINKIKIKRIIDEKLPKEEYKTIDTAFSVTPDSPLYMIVQRSEAIACYMIEWKIDYGECARYYFYENLRNGQNNISGITYSSSIISKIRLLLGWR